MPPIARSREVVRHDGAVSRDQKRRRPSSGEPSRREDRIAMNRGVDGYGSA
jgi:hypothetical protein